MNIIEAIRKAQEIGGYIERESWCGHLQMTPTDSPEGFIGKTREKGECPRWQPQANDLLADDWKVTTKELI